MTVDAVITRNSGAGRLLPIAFEWVGALPSASALLWVFALLWGPAQLPDRAAAQSLSGDGAYGRLQGDTTVSAGLGAGVATAVQQVYCADFRARYLDSAGLVLSPEWRPEGEAGLATAVELRPLFLGRFLTNQYTGRSWVDLTLDSIGLELGTWIGPLSEHTGVALLAGAGIDMPLGGDGQQGLWLRFGGRFYHALETDNAAPKGGRSEAIFAATLYYRATINLGLASWEPARYRLARLSQ